MKASLAGLARRVLRMFGQPRVARFISRFAQLAGLDLLMLGYNSIGILNYKDMVQSGETFLVKRVLKRYIPTPKPVLLDVGANVGDYSQLLFASFPNARLYAFEPNPNTFQLLEANLRGSGIVCVPMGLGSEIATETLFVQPNDPSSPHATKFKEMMTSFYRCVPQPVQCSLMTLDSFCVREGISKIDFLKIDTEGNELEVLKGARSMLSQNRIALLQFEFGECAVFSRVFMKDFYDLLPNYRFFRLNAQQLVPMNEYYAGHEIFHFQNILAVNKHCDLSD